MWPIIDFRNFHVFPFGSVCVCVRVRACARQYVCVCVWRGGGVARASARVVRVFDCVCVRVSGLTECVSLLCNALCAPLWRNSA